MEKTAYKKISSPEYQSFRWRTFETIGCLITSDGSGNDKIKPEDLPEYHVLPPYDYTEAALALPETPTCKLAAAEPDDLKAVTHVSDKDINEEELVPLE